IDVSFHYDQDADLAFRNSVDIGFEITYESGRIQRTAGLLNGLGGWQKLHLELEKGVRFSEGKLYYSRKKAMLAKDGITIIVKTKQKWQFEKVFHLKVPRIIDFEVALLPDQQIRPGSPLRFTFQATYSNGKVYSTHYGTPLLSPTLFRADTNSLLQKEGVPVDTYYLPDLSEDELKSHNVRFYLHGDSSLQSQLNLSVLLQNDERWDFAGLAGLYGGGHGSPGQQLELFVLPYNTGSTDVMLEVIAVSAYQQKRCFLDPANAKLHIDCGGGKGGPGFDGQTGLPGDDATDTHCATNGGNGQNGGNGGDGGIGGNLRIYCPPNLKAFLSAIVIHNPGGTSGLGGQGGQGGPGGHGNEVFPEDGDSGHTGQNGVNGMRGLPGAIPDYVLLSANEIRRLLPKQAVINQ
ncbi:MAG: hypothetical protein AAFQ68_12835, partial [Bacteroidota bacterium]